MSDNENELRLGSENNDDNHDHSDYIDDNDDNDDDHDDANQSLETSLWLADTERHCP